MPRSLAERFDHRASLSRASVGKGSLGRFSVGTEASLESFLAPLGAQGVTINVCHSLISLISLRNCLALSNLFLSSFQL